MARHLRSVPRPSAWRPSVIVDRGRGARMTPPWTVEDHEAMRDAAVPPSVMRGMWIAAWARAEHCPFNIRGGRLEPHARYEPSADLWIAVAQGMGDVVGALGFAVPICLDEQRVPYAATWPMTFGTSGEGSRN